MSAEVQNMKVDFSRNKDKQKCFQLIITINIKGKSNNHNIFLKKKTPVIPSAQ